MKNIVIKPLTNLPYEQDVEIVERKGIGHPDTICDKAAEQVSVELSKFYLKEFGSIMHHNVDKALLVGGVSNPGYNGGKITKPIEFIIAGRATSMKNEKDLPINEIAIKAIKNYFKRLLRHLDVDRDLAINVKIRPGSIDLVELYERIGKGEVPLSNDTSYGTGFYPFDKLENSVYATEKFLNSNDVKKQYPYIGEDIKVMGIREKNKIKLTISIAIIDKYVSNINDYIDKISKIKKLLQKQVWIDENDEIKINSADSLENESIYLTVSGTSAEHGDDGEVGRGNRVNGLITPGRQMTLEAVAGKNPISHVGKLYNIFAYLLSKKVVEKGYVSEASVNIVSRIGIPIDQPQILELKVKDQAVNDKYVIELSKDMLKNLPLTWRNILEGKYEIA